MQSILRKCPACKEMVGADSEICPRCGVKFRAALFRRWFLRLASVAMLVYLLRHFWSAH